MFDRKLVEAFNIKYGISSPDAILSITADQVIKMSEEDFNVYEQLFTQVVGDSADDIPFTHIDTNEDGYPIYTKETDGNG